MEKKGSIRLTGIFLILFVFSLNLQAQEILIDAEGQSLNEVLVEIRDSYDLNFSFDDKNLSQYQITIHQKFSSPEKALEAVLQDLPLVFEKLGEVYVIYPAHTDELIAEKNNTRVFGVITDQKSGEALPYSHVMLNDIGFISDAHGRFVFNVEKDSVYNLKVSHLGFFRLDTLIRQDGVHNLFLLPNTFGLKEVVVRNKNVNLSIMSLQNSGEIHLNHQVGSYLPGFADNSLYNLLRLQPGVLAAGEKASDLIIWGSYSGQTGILFDGFTLYSLKNFNDNIGVVNPFMVKDIKLLKGAYSADYGGKAGGIVDITGNNGSISKPDFQLSATNLILNAKLSVPIAKRASLSLAFRKTYYNIYNIIGLDSVFRARGNGMIISDLTVYPDYSFNDFATKFSGKTKGGDRYYIDFLRGADVYSYSANYDLASKNFETSRYEGNTQLGGSLYYGKTWQNGNTSDILMTASNLKQLTELTSRYTNQSGNLFDWKDEAIDNTIKEISIKQSNHFSIHKKHSLDFGIGFKGYQIEFEQDSSNFDVYNDIRKTLAAETFIQDRISISDGLTAKVGLRIDLPFLLRRPLIQPRFSLSYQASENIWLKAAWGKYDQYVVQSSLVDELGNYRFFWTISDGEQIPLQSSHHYSAGVTYSGKSFSVGLEGFYKKMTGLTRFVNRQRIFDQKVFLGEGKTMGVDFLLEGGFLKHRALLGYTLSQTTERFDYFILPVFIRSPHDQRHEIKGALIMNFDPFFLSTNYVYGSGFPSRFFQQQQTQSDDNLRYSRWDVSATYRFGIRKVNMEFGLSILNLLNTKNIKYQDFVKMPFEDGANFSISAEAVPFTPTIFLIAKF